ncbi:MAG: hypothetical protein ACJ8FK_18460 [Xanthobacteraceae bacterium]
MKKELLDFCPRDVLVMLSHVACLESRRMGRSWIGIGALALLGACTSLMPLDMSAESETGPADYQTLVAKNLVGLKDRAFAGPFEISALRRTRLAQPGDWMACVRTTVQERPTYLAFFMREGRVLDWRLAVLIDECTHEQFQPLPEYRPPPPDPKASDAKSSPEAKSSPKSSTR